MQPAVDIVETIEIHPCTPPFSEDHITLALSHLDTDRNLNVTFRYLRVYANAVSTGTTSNANDPFNVIANALSAALLRYFPLAGSLRRRGVDSRLEVVCTKNELNLPLTYARVNCTLESINYLDDDTDPEFANWLVPDPGGVDGLSNPCALQVAMFKCDGFTLGAAIHHALCDGTGGTQFFTAVAELARGVSKVSVEPVWNRKELLGPREPPRVKGVVEEFLSLERGVGPYGQEIGKVVRECVHVKDEWADRLKKLLGGKSGSAFTTFEALGAFIWRAKIKATGVPGEETVKFAYSINIRKLTKPPLPNGYWGNGCVPMYAKLLAKDLVQQPLWVTAEQIKKSKTYASDEYVRSYIDYQELHYGDGITGGKRVSGFTDWRHLGHSSVDFGWGAPVNVLPISRELLGNVEPCNFLPYSSTNSEKKNGFKVLVNLQESALPGFRTEMEKLGDQDLHLF